MEVEYDKKTLVRLLPINKNEFIWGEEYCIKMSNNFSAYFSFFMLPEALGLITGLALILIMVYFNGNFIVSTTPDLNGRILLSVTLSIILGAIGGKSCHNSFTGDTQYCLHYFTHIILDNT